MQLVEERELLYYYKKLEDQKQYLQLYYPTHSKKDSTKSNKNQMKIIEMPTAIKKEQHIFCKEQRHSNGLGNFLLEKVKKNDLKNRENDFYTHKIEMEDLVVIGQAIPDELTVYFISK